MARFLIKVLELGLAAKCVSTNHRPSKMAVAARRVQSRKKVFFVVFS